MNATLETLMYQLGQVFMFPVLAAVAVLFIYAFYALGAFAVQAWQRRGGMNAGPGFPLLAYARDNPGRSEDDLDVAAHKMMEHARIATRVAPMLGLVATMIPMGPALKSLADGNLASVSHNLTVAFSAVILALIAASITFWIVSVRRRWLAEEMAWLTAKRPVPAAAQAAPLAQGSAA
ncbi:MAG: MotA/TolQ/ExbB proton channel family protein [Betaproteobacteria bacterium]|nr:MotA/TolQ/ExbB proton channel family protein [Betaproteobacteria bacterium]